MNKIKRLAIIPARLGSKRIKKKNIRLFYGKPIISYPITELKKTNIFDKIFVSTESKSIKLISEKFGASVDFLRPKKLSGDNIPLKDVLKNTLSIFDELGEIYDEIWLVYACNPLIKKEDFIKAKKQFFKSSKLHPLMSIKEFEAPIEWAYDKHGKIYKSINKKKLYLDSKKIKKKYFECASFVVYTRKHIESKKSHFVYYGFHMPNHRAIDIDSESDWKHALNLFKIQKNDKI
jgi:pseudaminic acid cytidylyltransferase